MPPSIEEEIGFNWFLLSGFLFAPTTATPLLRYPLAACSFRIGAPAGFLAEVRPRLCRRQLPMPLPRLCRHYPSLQGDTSQPATLAPLLLPLLQFPAAPTIRLCTTEVRACLCRHRPRLLDCSFVDMYSDHVFCLLYHEMCFRHCCGKIIVIYSRRRKALTSSQRGLVDMYVWAVNGSSLFRIYLDESTGDSSRLHRAIYSQSTYSLMELKQLRPASKHELFREIVYGSKLVVDNSKLLICEIRGQLQNRPDKDIIGL
ncbi:Unknown protein [Striga hermonthica]|uniref:Uncharacterized protein n=1 Tax=Striga hermonthica TaxID=68872 RepID=A0A9N7R239_STRHE|nr:Unknown protein [Striga hermonthica]